MRARTACLVDQLLEQKVRACRAFSIEHAFQRIQPFPRFLRVYIVFKEAGAVHENLLI